MEQSTITQTGQTTIPSAVRKSLGLKPGDKVRYFEDGGHWVLLPTTSDITALKGILPKPKRALSIEEMDEGIMRHFRKKP